MAILDGPHVGVNEGAASEPAVQHDVTAVAQPEGADPVAVGRPGVILTVGLDDAAILAAPVADRGAGAAPVRVLTVEPATGMATLGASEPVVTLGGHAPSVHDAVYDGKHVHAWPAWRR